MSQKTRRMTLEEQYPRVTFVLHVHLRASICHRPRPFALWTHTHLFIPHVYSIGCEPHLFPRLSLSFSTGASSQWRKNPRNLIAVFNFSEAMFCSIFCRWRWVWMVVWHLMVWVMFQPFSQPWKERCRNQDRDNRDVAVGTNSSVLCLTHSASVSDCSLLSP